MSATPTADLPSDKQNSPAEDNDPQSQVGSDQPCHAVKPTPLTILFRLPLLVEVVNETYVVVANVKNPTVAYHWEHQSSSRCIRLNDYFSR